MVLGAAEGLNSLAVRRAGRVDVLGDRSRPDETDCSDVGMLENAVDGDFVALNHIEHAGGKAGLGEELGHEECDGRVLLAGLQDEAVTGGNRVCEHPHWNHGREVERRDAGNDPEGLFDGVDVDASRHLLAVPAFEKGGDPAGELDVLEATGELASRVARHFAVLNRH